MQRLRISKVVRSFVVLSSLLVSSLLCLSLQNWGGAISSVNSALHDNFVDKNLHLRPLTLYLTAWMCQMFFSWSDLHLAVPSIQMCSFQLGLGWQAVDQLQRDVSLTASLFSPGSRWRFQYPDHPKGPGHPEGPQLAQRRDHQFLLAGTCLVTSVDK